MTLLKPWKMQELAEEIEKTQTEILALQETRWPGKEQINKKDYTLYYSRSKGKTGQAGTVSYLGIKYKNTLSAMNYITNVYVK